MIIPIQYQNSPIIRSMIGYIQSHFDTKKVLDEFYDKVMNFDTANGYGLDVWGRIVGANRYLSLSIPDQTFFGFKQRETATSLPSKPFNQAVFYKGENKQSELYRTYRLSDEAYRKFILLRAAMNIEDMSIYGINRILNLVWGDVGGGYCIDEGNMTMSYHFNFKLKDWEFAVLTNYQYSPHPIGVRINEITWYSPDTFMFEETGYLEPMGQDPFLNIENYLKK